MRARQGRCRGPSSCRRPSGRAVAGPAACRLVWRLPDQRCHRSRRSAGERQNTNGAAKLSVACRTADLHRWHSAMQHSGCSGQSCSAHRLQTTPLTVPHWFSGVSSSSRPDCAVLPSLPTKRVGTAQEAESQLLSAHAYSSTGLHPCLGHASNPTSNPHLGSGRHRTGSQRPGTCS